MSQLFWFNGFKRDFGSLSLKGPKEPFCQQEANGDVDMSVTKLQLDKCNGLKVLSLEKNIAQLQDDGDGSIVGG